MLLLIKNKLEIRKSRDIPEPKTAPTMVPIFRDSAKLASEFDADELAPDVLAV